MNDSRAPTHLEAREAELSVLGAILLDNTAIGRLNGLPASAFFVPAHRIIFEQMCRLVAAEEPVDTVTLTESLQRRNLLDQVGGVDYLISLDQAAATAVNIGHHSRIISDAATQRRLAEMSRDLHDLATSGRPVDEVLATIQAEIRDVADRRPRPTAWQSTADLMPAAIETVGQRKAGKSTEAPTLKSRFVDAERLIGGLGESDMMILAGRPSMGKTAAALQLAVEYARDAHDKGAGAVLFFSLETTMPKLVDRLLAAEARVDLNRIKRGQLYDSEMGRLRAAASRLAGWPLHFDARKGLTVEDITGAVASWKGPVAAVFVDYLQIIKTRARFHSREQAVAHIAQGLKDLADRGGTKAPHLNTRVVALAQLSRPDKRRPGSKVPRPTIADIRESGHIEQCADVIVLLHRPAYYDPEGKGVDVRGAEWIVGKNRDGGTGVAQLRYFGERVRFENLAQMDVMEAS